MMVKIRLLSNYEDKDYICLNGLEIYDNQFQPLLYPRRLPFTIYADPNVATSSNLVNDKRVPENLVNGRNEGEEFDKFFLAPYINSKKLDNSKNLGKLFNQVFIFFEDFVTISAISFWNYSKTPTRGVKDVEVFVDESLVYSVTRM
jgi:hypothetical protein